MEKFGMSFGGGPSKKELLDTIEAQKKQLIQYQTRFKDVVQAYKGLLKEKEALEASLKVLTVSQEVELQKGLQSGGSSGPTECPVISEVVDHSSHHSEDSLDTATSVGTATSVSSSGTKRDPAEEDQNSHEEFITVLQESEKASVLDNCVLSSSSTAMGQTVAELDHRVIQLKSQLATLTLSLTIVTQEKSRMEASFQVDKRKIKQELDETHKKMEEAVKQHQKDLQTLQEQLAESRARVITQQHEREQEQSDHAHMLRELQKLLQEERSLRQDVELKLEDSRETLVETMQAADRGLDYEEQLKKVAQECETLRNSLEAADVERNLPNQRVVELEKEIADLKAHFNQQLQQEIQKVTQAEEGLREQAQLEEQRVASLEERVSELSELLGTSEKARQKDQLNVQKLRERLLQLDAENKTLAITASTVRTSSLDLDIDESNLDVNTLRNRMEKVTKQLQLAAQRSPDQGLEIKKLLDGGMGQDGEKVQYYQQELRQVREEFERYKVRAQVVLKNKNTKDGTQAKELEDARDQLSELKEKYINLRVQLDEAEVKHKQEVEDHHQSLVALKQAHKHELEKLEAQHRDNLLHIERELHKQRERTIALLEEKDLELEKLRVFRNQNVWDQREECASERGVERDLSVETGHSGLEDCDTISEALRFAGSNEPTLLLYAEQMARNEVEISTLRKMKHRLEEDLYQLQAKLIANGERQEEELTELRAQLEKQMRDKGREGANLEYLKNVIYRFLTLQDSRGRQQTLTAILTILHFSPQEKQTIVKQHVQSWWTPAMR